MGLLAMEINMTSKLKEKLLSLKGPWIGDGITKIHRDEIIQHLDTQNLIIKALESRIAQFTSDAIYWRQQKMKKTINE